MTITAVTGDIGSGKSLKQLQFALQCCNRYKKKLVTNFGLNIPAIKRYAVAKKYWWVVWLCDNDQISIFDLSNNEDLVKILSIPSSVVCLDEAGIFLNTREFAKTPRQLLSDLAQSRKTGCDLIYAAQFDGQVDKQFRMLTQYFIHAQGTSFWSPQLRNQKLVWRTYYTFNSTKYWEWAANFKKRNSFLKTWYMAISTEIGPLRKSDLLAFECFESFSRLDMQAQNVRTARTSYTEEELRIQAISDRSKVVAWRVAAARARATWQMHPLHKYALSPRYVKQISRHLP